MSPEEIKAKAFDQVVLLVTELPEFPNREELAELLEKIQGLDYVVTETISGQMAEYRKRLEEV